MFYVEIPKRSLCCVKGGEPFLPGSQYYSTIMLEEKGERYQREDYCMECWKKGHPSSDSQMISSWKSIVPIKKELSELPKRRDERALYLLKEILVNPNDSSTNSEAFILALFLARRRLIVLRQEVIREGKLPLCIYEVMETEEMLSIPKIPLSDLQVETLRLELAKKFHAK